MKGTEYFSNDYINKAGLRFSATLIILSLAFLVEIKISNFEIYLRSFDWLFVFLIGLALFFFFLALTFNTRTTISENKKPNLDGTITTSTTADYIMPLDYWNGLSKKMFFISVLCVIIAVIRLVFIIRK